MGLKNLVYGLQNLLYLFPFTWYGIFHSNIHDRIYMLEVEDLQEVGNRFFPWQAVSWGSLGKEDSLEVLVQFSGIKMIPSPR